MNAVMEHDALDAHLRDELGLSDAHSANPMQAAFFSAAAFTAGSIIPVLIASYGLDCRWCFTDITGHFRGFSRLCGRCEMIRVVVWGAIAMGVTTGVGLFFGSVA